jgi:hypothetical protein
MQLFRPCRRHRLADLVNKRLAAEGLIFSYSNGSIGAILGLIVGGVLEVCIEHYGSKWWRR